MERIRKTSADGRNTVSLPWLPSPLHTPRRGKQNILENRRYAYKIIAGREHIRTVFTGSHERVFTSSAPLFPGSVAYSLLPIAIIFRLSLSQKQGFVGDANGRDGKGSQARSCEGGPEDTGQGCKRRQNRFLLLFNIVMSRATTAVALLKRG